MAACAREVAGAGAAMLHLHVREADGGHSLDPGLYREWTSEIRQAVGGALVVQITSEAAGLYAPEEQMRSLRQAGAEAVSVALREIMPRDDDREAERFYAWLWESGAIVQHILYSPAEHRRFCALAGCGTFGRGPHFVLFVLGREAEAGPIALAGFLAPPPDEHWMVCAFGRGERAAVTAAAGLGGHVRVGFENSLQRPDGSVLAGNGESVAAMAEAARLIGRPLMGAAQMRATFAR